MPTPRPAEGTTIELGDQAGVVGTTYTDIGEVFSITPPGGTRASVNRTALTDLAKKFRGGQIPDYGEVSFSIYYDPNDPDHQNVASLFDSGETRNFRVTYVTGNTSEDANDTFDAFITGITPGAAADEVDITWDLTLKITGAVTRNAGTDV